MSQNPKQTVTVAFHFPGGEVVSVDFPRAEWRAVKTAAKKHGQSADEFCEEALAEFLDACRADHGHLKRALARARAA